MADAASAVAVGEGVFMDHLLEYHYLFRKNDKRIENMNLGEFIEARKSGKFEPVEIKNDLFLQQWKANWVKT